MYSICELVCYLDTKWSLVKSFDLVLSFHYPEIYPQLKELMFD